MQFATWGVLASRDFLDDDGSSIIFSVWRTKFESKVRLGLAQRSHSQCANGGEVEGKAAQLVE